MLEPPKDQIPTEGKVFDMETMDNQQVTLNEASLGWMGGIWDGEGSFSTIFHKNMKTVHPRVSIVNTDANILSRICKILDLMNIHYYMYEKGRGGFAGSNKQCYNIQINRLNEIGLFINYILPYLVGKKAQAELLKRFIDTRLKRRTLVTRNSDCKYTSEELEMLAQVCDLNGNIHGTSETLRAEAKNRLR